MLKIALDSLKYGESKNLEDKHDEYQYINLIKHILDYDFVSSMKYLVLNKLKSYS